MNFNWKLKKQISDKFRHQWRFAAELRIQEATVSKVISGRVKLNDEKQKLWAKALDCDVADIFE